MAILLMIGFLEVFLSGVWFFIVGYYLWSTKNKKLPVTNWPVAGMLPAILVNLHRLHDKVTEILDQSGCTFLYRGPWFSGTDMLLTVDPANIHYIMSQNFPNFPKGSKFRQIFAVLGDGIFNSDDQQWRDQRKMSRTLMSHDRFLRFSKSANDEKLRNGLIPVLDHLSAQEKPVDLQDLLQRFTFDATSVLVSGFDPRSLSVDLPDIPYIKAMDAVEEALIYRHIFPQSLWKFMRWLDVGQERKLSRGWRNLDEIVEGYISKKRRELGEKANKVDGLDVLASFIRMGLDDDKFLRDVIVNLMTAGRDTTSAALSWFFWLLSKNPSAKNKIREELETTTRDFNNMSKLVYLHGALCETLRLYPSVPFLHKSPLKPDVLPTGHRVDPNSNILLDVYAMGRMRSIWGDDCLEFKPERWISERGRIKHEPSYKFLAFNAGPRTCLGKELAFTQMKMVAAAILENYEIEVFEGQKVVPSLSILLHMKHGLMVKVSKRL